MSDLATKTDSRAEARRKRREQRTDERRRSDPSLAVTELSETARDSCSDRKEKGDVVTRSRSSTDTEGELSKALTSEEKREERRERRRQKGGMAGETKGPIVPVVSDISTLNLRERNPENEVDFSTVNGVEQEADSGQPDQAHEYNPIKKRGGYENYSKALRKGETGSDVGKRKQKLAAAADGYHSDEDEIDVESEHLKVDQVTGEVKATAPVKRIKENYLASASGTGAKAPRTVHIDKPNNVKKQWPPPRPTPDDEEEDEDVAPRRRQPVVKTFEHHDEEDKGGVDEEHVQSVHSLKGQWSSRPFDKNRPAPGVNKPHIGVKQDVAWIKHFRPAIDEGDAPKEPSWLKMVRQRRWLSTVRARFPQTEEEARAFAHRSTTPQKPAHQNQFTIMRSKSDLDDDFQEMMRRRRQKSEDLSNESASNIASASHSRVRRSMSAFSEGDKDRDTVDTFLVLNKVPVKGPLKEYKKNVQLERARTTMLNWTFSTDRLEDADRFELPTPVDLQAMDVEDRDIGIYSVSSSSTSSAVFVDEDFPDASSTPYQQRHSGSESSDEPGRPCRKRVKDIKRSLSESSHGDMARASVEDLEVVPKVTDVKDKLRSSRAKPVYRTTPEEEIMAIPKVRQTREQLASSDSTDGPKTVTEEELLVCPKMKDLKEKLTKPKDPVKSKGVQFQKDQPVAKISDIKNQFSAQQQEKLKHSGKPNIDAKKIYKGSDFESVMSHRKHATDDSDEGAGSAAEEIKSLASDIAKTFGSEDKRSKDLDRYAEGIKDEDVHCDGGGHGLHLYHKVGKLKKPIIERQLRRKPAKLETNQEKPANLPDVENVRNYNKPVAIVMSDDTASDRSSEEDADVDKGGSQKPDKGEKSHGDESDQSDDDDDDDDDDGETGSEKEQKADKDDDSDSDGGEDGSDEEKKDKKKTNKSETEEEEDDDDDDDSEEDEEEEKENTEVKEVKETTPKRIKIKEVRNREERKIKVEEIPEKEGTEIKVEVKNDEKLKIKVEERKEKKEVSIEVEDVDDREEQKEKERRGETIGNQENEKIKLDETEEKEEDDSESSESENESDIEDSDDEGDDNEDGSELLVSPTSRPLSTSFEVLKKVGRPIQDERPRSFAFDEPPKADPILDNYRSFADHRRRIMPARRHVAKRNPVKERLNRDDLRTETDYLVVKGETNKVKEVKGLKKPLLTGQRRKEQSFSSEALAGLSSKENLSNRSLALRKTAKDKSGVSTEIKAHGGFLPVMLLHIKGQRNLQVRLVEPTAKSLNSGDVFVLVLPKEIHVWNGKDTTILKKAKGTEVSTIIVKQKDLGCTARKAHVIEQNKEMIDAPTKSFWKALGGKPAKITDGKTLPTNDEHEKGLTATNLVYRVNCSRDPPELLRRKDMSGKVLSEKFMDDAQAYVLDFGTEVYLWLGRNCPKDARVNGTGLAKEIFNGKFRFTSVISPFDPTKKAKVALKAIEVDRPKWALFGRMTQRSETVLFRSKFTDWPDHNVDYTQDFVKRPLSGSFVTLKTTDEQERPKSIFELKPVEVPSMVEDPSEPSFLLEGFDIGRGTGSTDEEGKRFVVSTNSVKIWHVKEYSYSPLPEEDYGHFHSSEGYVVRWKYCVKRTGVKSLKGKKSTYEDVGRDKVAYFFWQGKDSTVNEKGTAALMTVELNSDKGPQVLVSQGKEPPCFPRLFNGKMVTHTGKRDEGQQDGVDMFFVRNEEPEEVFLIQIPASSQALRSRASFIILDTKKSMIYTWHGCKSSTATRHTAVNSADHFKLWYANKLSKSVDTKEVEEGEEPFRDFWKSIGGKSNYCTLLKDSKTYDFTMRVFQMNSSSGKFESTEVLNPARSSTVCPFPILQQHLYSGMQPALFLVDAKHELYLWQGWWPVDEEEGETRASTTGSAATRWSNDRRLAMETIKSYAEELKRDLTQAYIVFAGVEPPTFKSLFPFWEDREDVAKLNKEEGRKDGEILKLVDQLAKLSRDTYSLEELKARPLPEGVDPTRLEAYLSHKDFEKAFGMSKNKFDSLPQWKKPSLKKQAGLF